MMKQVLNQECFGTYKILSGHATVEWRTWASATMVQWPQLVTLLYIKKATWPDTHKSKQDTGSHMDKAIQNTGSHMNKASQNTGSDMDNAAQDTRWHMDKATQKTGSDIKLHKIPSDTWIKPYKTLSDTWIKYTGHWITRGKKSHKTLNQTQIKAHN